jgi:hypothetical protein
MQIARYFRLFKNCPTIVTNHDNFSITSQVHLSRQGHPCGWLPPSDSGMAVSGTGSFICLVGWQALLSFHNWSSLPPPSHSKTRHSNPVHLFLLWKPRHTGRLYSSPTSRSKTEIRKNMLSSLNLKLFFFLRRLGRSRINTKSRNWLVGGWTHWGGSFHRTAQHKSTQRFADKYDTRSGIWTHDRTVPLCRTVHTDLCINLAADHAGVKISTLSKERHLW